MERINWELPLETDEETPRPAVLGAVQLRDCPIAVMIGSRQFSYTLGGEPMDILAPRIRNVRTVDTNRDDAFRRMEALIRKLADLSLPWRSVEATKEAREIVKLLPAPPVDPLLIEARRIVTEVAPGLDEETLVGMYDDGAYVRIALAALKRGQELAHGEYESYGAIDYGDANYTLHKRAQSRLA